MQALLLDAVPADVAGQAIMNEQEFTKKLGRATFLVWEVLRASRDKTGAATMTIPEVAKAVNSSPSGVRNRLQRLRKMGLLVGSPRGLAEVRVRGGRGLWDGRDVLLVPPITHRKLRTLQGRGGSHTSSNGSKGDKTRQPVVTAADSSKRGQAKAKGDKPTPTKAKGDKTPSEAKGTNSTQVPEIIGPDDQKGTNPSIKLSSYTLGCSPLPSEEGREKRPASAGPSISSSSTEDQVACPDKGAPEPGAAEVDGELGLGIRGAGRSFIGWRYPGVPGLPDVVFARIPPPPLVEADWARDRKVEFLCATYTHAVEARYGKGGKPAKCWVLKGKKKPRMGDEMFMFLLDAAETLEEAKLPPSVWVAFSLDVWDHSQGSEDVRRRRNIKWPAPKWTFGLPRINKNRGWCRSDAGNTYVGGLMLMTPHYKDLQLRHSMMRATLMRKEQTSQAAVDAIVRRAFPDDTYERLLTAAQKEVAEMK